MTILAKANGLDADAPGLLLDTRSGLRSGVDPSDRGDSAPASSPDSRDRTGVLFAGFGAASSATRTGGSSSIPLIVGIGIVDVLLVVIDDCCGSAAAAPRWFGALLTADWVFEASASAARSSLACSSAFLPTVGKPAALSAAFSWSTFIASMPAPVGAAGMLRSGRQQCRSNLVNYLSTLGYDIYLEIIVGLCFLCFLGSLGSLDRKLALARC